MKQKTLQMSKRILCYCAGLFLMAMGVSFSGKADLGMSPVNSIPYVLSEIYTSLSMGRGSSSYSRCTLPSSSSFWGRTSSPGASCS